tara:strand:+ start:4929 stop:5261 length:333 start_codon:yes stop_codon:yes gene_type:complete
VTLRQTIARHAAGALTRADHFGEDVIVVQGEVSTTVSAVIDRLDVEPMDSTSRIVRLTALVFLPVSNLPSTPTAGDRVTLAMRLGDAATSNRITRLVSQDEGGVLVEVQS